MSLFVFAMFNSIFSFFKRQDQRWNREPFLKSACDLIGQELDPDSVDFGRLHHTAGKAKTWEGESIIVAVLDRTSLIAEVLEDAKAEGEYEGLANASLWLYVPEDLVLDETLNESIVIRRVVSPAP